MAPYLSPVEKPKGLMFKLGYRYTKKQFGQVPGPLSVFCARMPLAFSSFYGKVSKLDRKLTLDDALVVLAREQVASTTGCAFCMDSNGWAALNKASVPPAKLAALADFETSDVFTDRERAALGFVTEVARDRRCSPDTIDRVRRHYSDRKTCELAWIVASEHLYNINNIALGIGSQGLCELPAIREAVTAAA